MGSFSSLLKMIPGMANIKDLKVDDKEFVRIEAIICSMTKEEMTQKMMKKVQNGKGGLKNMMKNINPNDLKKYMK